MVGNYIRTKYGRIGRITSFNKCVSLKVRIDDLEKAKTEDIVYVDTNYNFDDEKDSYLVSEIVKQSSNLTDLIESGDYVDGHEVYKVTPSCIFTRGGINYHKEDAKINSIVTKEQFKNMEYIVNE